MLFVDFTFFFETYIVIQRDVILEHEKSQLDQYKLIVDKKKTTLNKSLIGRWISISWRRTTDYNEFFAYDVGVVADIKKDGTVFVDYKDDGIYSVSLTPRGWDCSMTETPKNEKKWRLLNEE
jgi:hypothetical protein